MASILFVAYHFAPENVSGTHRSLHFARALADAGHSVAVLAGPEPLPSRSDPELQRVFPWTDRVHRVATPASVGSLYMAWKSRRATAHGPVTSAAPSSAAPAERKQGVLGRAMGELRRHLGVWDVLPDPYRPWTGAALRTGISLGRRIHADIIIASGPPWTGVRVGHRIARRLGVPFIADFRDPWSSGSGATWRAAAEWAQRRVERWEASVLADSAVVCFNSPRVASTATAISPLGDRSRVILNGSDVPRKASRTIVPNTAPLRIRHIGSLYHGRSVEPVVRALDALIDAGELKPNEVVLELIGDMEPAAGSRSLGETKVPLSFTPHLPFSEVAKRMAEPGMLVVVQTELYANQIPTKLFDYLCTGNTVLVLGPSSNAGWDIASQFPRCHQLDLDVTDRNRAVMSTLVAAWRRGELVQEPSVEDTRHLGKQPIGEEFVRLVEEVVASSPRNARRRGHAASKESTTALSKPIGSASPRSIEYDAASH